MAFFQKLNRLSIDEVETSHGLTPPDGCSPPRKAKVRKDGVSKLIQDAKAVLPGRVYQGEGHPVTRPVFNAFGKVPVCSHRKAGREEKAS